MQFSQIIGNEELRKLLPQIASEGRLSHAILLTEENPWGAVSFAIALAQYVNCEHPEAEDSCGECASCHKYGKLIHPDLHFVFPVSSAKGLTDSEKKAPISDYFLQQWRDLVLRKPFFSEQDLYDAIGIENKSGIISVHEAKRIMEKLSLRAFEGEYKTVIIYLPEKMNADAANKILKLLEEPPAGTLFIMISHNPERLLQTIRSRCQRIQLKPLTRDERRAAGLEYESNPEFDGIMDRLLSVAITKKVIDTFPIWEALAEMGREKQREWCLYAENYIRKICMVASSLDSIAEMGEGEEPRLRELARRLKPEFYEKAFGALESAMTGVESNVNAKLLFCNLCNIILLSA